MSREEFTKYYCNNSNITEEKFLKHYVVLKCDCGNEGCEGWAVVANDKESIERHYKLYTI